MSKNDKNEKHRLAEQIAGRLLAEVVFVNHSAKKVSDGKAGTFAHLTIGDVTAVGFDMLDALREILDAARQINAHGLSLDDFPERKVL